MLTLRTLGLLVALLSFTAVITAEELKVTHDWPGYTGPEGTYADQSKVPLLDDFSRAKLLWISEHDDLGYGKTSSRGGHIYGPKAKPSGSCDLIVASGLVIAGYFNPKNNVVADDIILAVDAATGKTKWKQVYAGQGYNRTARKHVQYAPTPTVADGKVFHLGSGGKIYCIEVATGKPLWEGNMGGAPERYKAATANMVVKDEVKDGVSGLMAGYATPLTVIGGVLMVNTPDDGFRAFDTATGKELWKMGGQSFPCPAKINGITYALCCDNNGDMRLVEPKTGKVLWTEKVARPPSHAPSFIAADGRLFVHSNEGKENPRLAAFALSETGAKLIWKSKDEGFGDGNLSPSMAYRDGVIYAGVLKGKNRLMAFKGEDGTVLSDFDATETISMAGFFYLWGDRLVLEGNHSHESIGHVCLYQALTPGVKDLKVSGHPLAPRTFGKYAGIAGYGELWMRPAFADGLIFTRSVNRENGKGAILCWDLRTRPNSKMLKFQIADLLQGNPKAQNLLTVEAEVEAGNLIIIFTKAQMRSPTASIFGTVHVKGMPQEITPLVAGRWKGAVDVELGRDGETWQFDLDTSKETPSGTCQRMISALAKPIDVEGIADAAEMVPDPKAKPLPENTKQWMVTLRKSVCPESDGPIDTRRDMYIVVTRFANGEQEAFARARRMNISTHEVQVSSFAADEKTLTLKGTVLFHSDQYVNPSDQRSGTVAMDVEVTLTGDGKNWKGTYKGRYGSAWTGDGKIGAVTTPADGKLPPNEGVK